MSFTTTALERVLRGFLGQSSNTILSNCYMGLSSTAPSADGSNFTEPSDSAGYARAIIGLESESATRAMTITGGRASNSKIIFFPEATSSWGTVSYFGLFSGPTSEKPLIYGALSSSISIPANYVPLFRVGNFVLTLS